MLVLQHFQLPVHFIQDKNGGSKVKVAYVKVSCPIKQHPKFLCEKIISQAWLVQKPFIFHPDIVQPKY